MNFMACEELVRFSFAVSFSCRTFHWSVKLCVEQSGGKFCCVELLSGSE